MADIVTMSAYRSAHDRLRSKRASNAVSTPGPATLLLFTGVRREPIIGPQPKVAVKEKPARRKTAFPAPDR